MNFHENDPKTISESLMRGGLSDLRSACDFADRIVDAVERAGDVEELKKGFHAFRARNGYIEDDTSHPGHTYFNPLIGKDVCAPSKDITNLGRFNAQHNPVLYLSTTREVSLAETRALSSDTCTVATFITEHPLRLAKLLKKRGAPLGWLLADSKTDEDFYKLLLDRTSEFVSRRVTGNEREIHYRSCNLIASAFMERGFDALAYRTSFWSEGWRDGKRSDEEEAISAANIVLFNPQDARPVAASLYQIDWGRPSAEQAGNSHWRAKS